MVLLLTLDVLRTPSCLGPQQTIDTLSPWNPWMGESFCTLSNGQTLIVEHLPRKTAQVCLEAFKEVIHLIRRSANSDTHENHESTLDYTIRGLTNSGCTNGISPEFCAVFAVVVEGNKRLFRTKWFCMVLHLVPRNSCKTCLPSLYITIFTPAE